MAILDNIRQKITFEADTREVTTASRTVKNLNEKVEELAQSSATLSAALSTTNRKLDSQSRAAATTSGSLASLQTQTAAAQAAQLALADAGGDVQDALATIDEEAKREGIRQLTDHVHDLEEGLESVSHTMANMSHNLSDLDRGYIEDIMGWLSDPNQGLTLTADFDSEISDLHTIQEGLEEIEEQGLTFEGVFGDLLPDSAGGDDLIDIFGEEGNLTAADLLRADAKGNLASQLGAAGIDVDDEGRLLTRIFRDTDRDSDLWDALQHIDVDEEFLGEATTLSDDAISSQHWSISDFLDTGDKELEKIFDDRVSLSPNEFREQLIRGLWDDDGGQLDADAVGEDKLSGTLLNDVVRNTDFTGVMGDTGADSFEEALQERWSTPRTLDLRTLLRGENFLDNKAFGPDTFGPSELAAMDERGLLDKGLGDIFGMDDWDDDSLRLKLEQAGLDTNIEAFRSRVKSALNTFTEGQEGWPDNIDDFAETMGELGGVMDESETFERMFASADDTQDALQALNEQFGDHLEMFDLQQELYNKYPDIIDEFDENLETDEIVDVGFNQQTRESAIAETLESARPDDEDDVLGPDMTAAHAEVLDSIMGDLDPGLDADRQGFADLPITEETIRMGLLQELMSADADTEQFQMAQDLLTRLEAGELGVGATLFDSEGGVLQQDLARLLPDDMVAADLDKAIIEELQETGDGLSAFLGPDPEARLADPVSDAIDGTGFAGQRQTAIEALEELLPAARMRAAARTSPNMLEAIPGADGASVTGLSRRADEDIEAYIERVGRTMNDLADVQTQARATRGKKGLFPLIMGGASRILGAEIGGERQDHPTRIRALHKRLNGLSQAYNRIVPLLDVVSVNLGAANVRFRSMISLVAKVTALLGPLVAMVGALATGFGVAAAGAASFIGVGAMQYLEKMESTMAGVSDKSEAMQELRSTLGDMAWQALGPLRTAQLADGTTPMELFVKTLRGGLRLLHRFAAGMAQLASLPVVAEQLDRLAEIIHGGEGDSTFIDQMAVVLRNTLPMLVSLIEFVVNNFGPAMAQASVIAEKLGQQIGEIGRSSSSALGLLIMYGAGFYYILLEVVEWIGKAIMVLEEVVDALSPLLSIIPGVSDSLSGLAFQFGALVGVMTIVSKTATFLVQTYRTLIWTMVKLQGVSKSLSLLMVDLKKVHRALFLQNMALSASFTTVQLSVLSLAGAIASLISLIVIIHDIVAVFHEDIDALFFDFTKHSHQAIGAVLGLVSAFTLLKSIAFLGDAAVASGGLMQALGLSGLTTKLAGLTGTIGGLVASLGPLIVALSGLVAIMVVFHDAIAHFSDNVDTLIFDFSKLSHVIAGVVTALAGLTAYMVGAYAVAGKLFGGISTLTGAVSALGGSLAALSTGGLAVAIGLTVGVLADLVYYLATGETILGNIIGQAEKLKLMYELMVAPIRMMRESFQGAYEVIRSIRTLLPLGFMNALADLGEAYLGGGDGGGTSTPGNSTSRRVNSTSPFVTGASQSSGSDSNNDGPDPTQVSLTVNNQGYIGNRDFFRQVERRIENLLNNRMKQGQ